MNKLIFRFSKLPMVLIILFFCALPIDAKAGAKAEANECKNPSISVVGPEEPVYSYENEHCRPKDTPDSPAMAFINEEGRVVLFNGMAGSYPSTGVNLNVVKRDCKQALIQNNPDENAGPEEFANQIWLRDPWTFDGKTIYALVHNEWDNGSAGWWPNIIAAKSENGGKTFEILRDPNKKSIMAVVTPYKYSTEGGPQGIQQQSNILSRTEAGKTYFFMIVLSNVGQGHEGGGCLMRSDDIADPSRWRAWDGQGFNTSMNVNLYRHPNINPEEHVCKPIMKHGVSSWTYNTFLNQYIAVFHFNDKNEQGQPQETFAYSLSRDMIHWSKPVALKKINWLISYRESTPGSGVVGQAYPSLLDPMSQELDPQHKDRNFEFSGANPYLYYTRMPPKTKGQPWYIRDLVRQRLKVSCD